MPSRRLPNTTPTVVRALKAARDEWKNTPIAADRAISADQWAQLDDTVPTSLLNRFLGDVSAVDLAEAQQAPLVSAESHAAAKLTMGISHFHQVLDLGVARGIFSAGARGYYGRDITATSIPNLSSYAAIAEAGAAVVSGEAARQTAEGAAYVPMALPSAAEVGTLLTQFNILNSQNEQAQVSTNKQRGELITDYPAAQALAVDICDTVEFFYRKETNEATRRVDCQRWGVVYLYDTNAAPAPAPTTAASIPQPTASAPAGEQNSTGR